MCKQNTLFNHSTLLMSVCFPLAFPPSFISDSLTQLENFLFFKQSFKLQLAILAFREIGRSTVWELPKAAFYPLIKEHVELSQY